MTSDSNTLYLVRPRGSDAYDVEQVKDSSVVLVPGMGDLRSAYRFSRAGTPGCNYQGRLQPIFDGPRRR